MTDIARQAQACEEEATRYAGYSIAEVDADLIASNERRSALLRAAAATLRSLAPPAPLPADLVEWQPRDGERALVWIDLRGDHVHDRSYWRIAVWEDGEWRDGHCGPRVSNVTEVHPLPPRRLAEQAAALAAMRAAVDDARDFIAPLDMPQSKRITDLLEQLDTTLATDAGRAELECVRRMQQIVADAKEELRLIHMKDTDAIYNPGLRVLIDVVLDGARRLFGAGGAGGAG